MARPSSHPFDLLARRFAEIVAEKVAAASLLLLVAGQAAQRAPVPGPSCADASSTCAAATPGCKNRSKGPRFKFLCEEHLKLPKAEQNAALEKLAGKNS